VHLTKLSVSTSKQFVLRNTAVACSHSGLKNWSMIVCIQHAVIVIDLHSPSTVESACIIVCFLVGKSPASEFLYADVSKHSVFIFIGK
jgi:hypothetical protein